MRLRLISLPLVLAAFALAACGDTTANRHADNEGIYVDLGTLKYQVQLSRELNTYSAEDSAYVAGLPAATRRLAPSQAWFAVFMLVFNKSGQAQPAASTYYITDTQGTVYHPIPVAAGTNAFAYEPITIGPHGQLPAVDSPAFVGPTAAEVLLFKVPFTAFDNRPLVLTIADPRNPRTVATVDLDV